MNENKLNVFVCYLIKQISFKNYMLHNFIKFFLWKTKLNTELIWSTTIFFIEGQLSIKTYIEVERLLHCKARFYGSFGAGLAKLSLHAILLSFCGRYVTVFCKVPFVLWTVRYVFLHGMVRLVNGTVCFVHEMVV